MEFIICVAQRYFASMMTSAKSLNQYGIRFY